MDFSTLRQRYIALATLLISLGILFLLNNFKAFVAVDFVVWFNLWPLVFIFAGLYFLFKGRKAAYFITVITSLLLAVTVFSYLAITSIKIPFLPSISSRKSDINPNINIITTTEEINKNVDKANLMFKSFNGEFAVRGNTNSLTEYETKSTFGAYLFDRSQKDGVETVDLRFDQERFPWRITSEKNSLDLKLNSNPKWNLNLEVDRGQLAMELGYYKVSEMRVKLSASDADINFEEKTFDKNINFELDATVSTINIRVPKNVGIQVVGKTFATNKNFVSLKEIESNKFESENFNNAEKKLYLNIDTNLSTLKIEQF